MKVRREQNAAAQKKLNLLHTPVSSTCIKTTTTQKYLVCIKYNNLDSTNSGLSANKRPVNKNQQAPHSSRQLSSSNMFAKTQLLLNAMKTQTRGQQDSVAQPVQPKKEKVHRNLINTQYSRMYQPHGSIRSSLKLQQQYIPIKTC